AACGGLHRVPYCGAVGAGQRTQPLKVAVDFPQGIASLLRRGVRTSVGGTGQCHPRVLADGRNRRGREKGEDETSLGLGGRGDHGVGGIGRGAGSSTKHGKSRGRHEGKGAAEERGGHRSPFADSCKAHDAGAPHGPTAPLTSLSATSPRRNITVMSEKLPQKRTHDHKTGFCRPLTGPPGALAEDFSSHKKRIMNNFHFS